MSASGIWEQELIKWRGGNTWSSAKMQLQQRPAVHIGQTVQVGALLADGYRGLQLGRRHCCLRESGSGWTVTHSTQKTYRLRIEKTSYGEEVVGVKELQPWLELYGVVHVGTWLEKGIVVTSKFIPLLPDSTSLNVVLNPLGVPPRMNVGQVYETQLGLCALILSQQY